MLFASEVWERPKCPDNPCGHVGYNSRTESMVAIRFCKIPEAMRAGLFLRNGSSDASSAVLPEDCTHQLLLKMGGTCLLWRARTIVYELGCFPISCLYLSLHFSTQSFVKSFSNTTSFQLYKGGWRKGTWFILLISGLKGEVVRFEDRTVVRVVGIQTERTREGVV